MDSVSSLKRKRILLIEDEKDIRSLYSEVIESNGYEVLQAGDGKTALEIATHESWDLMLLDIVIPTIDGISLLEKLYEQKILKGRPVILLTNLGEDHIIATAFEKGATAYLIKSEITPDKIVSELKVYLG